MVLVLRDGTSKRYLLALVFVGGTTHRFVLISLSVVPMILDKRSWSIEILTHLCIVVSTVRYFCIGFLLWLLYDVAILPYRVPADISMCLV